ncbi:SURF1 family cytochrome oxidase biogenesis protein [Parablastomonas sp. CN1-191]|uniref:SURF1 family cytochrome oxidase biogenesis protein n=1 Tax=Parablastomonas sp. CN1-191 TaxID=3400908 RepID=UPI003BF89532
MTRRVPILATLLVIAAVATMIALGVWQLHRLAWKEDLIARYRQAEMMTTNAPWPRTPAEAERSLYRRAAFDCRAASAPASVSGRSAAGAPGIAHTADCTLPDGTIARVVLGWSRDPQPVAWSGGPVSGTLAPGPRLVADPPVAGLAANARPDPADLPNNHWSYAMQWFLFALTATVIYALALRRRMRVSG